MTITTNSHTLRGEESGLNLFAAIDAVADVMDRQIRKYKGKAYRTEQAKKSAKASAIKAAGPMAALDEPDVVGGEDSEEFGVIVRTKRFRMRPMSVEEAITEMELLNHDFFVFYNAASDEYNVVYRRRGGDYGIIEPELV